MGKQSTFATDFLKIVLQAVALANFWDNAGTSPATNLYISLHTADPTSSGNQTSSESAYTNYARVAVARTTGGWSVASAVGSNVAAIVFAQCGATGSTVTYFGVGRDSSGTGKLLYSGALTSPSSLVVNNGITPQFAIGALTLTES